MKVAITGATGFVGSRLVKRLQEQGHDSLVLTRDASKGRRVFPTSAFPRVQVVAYEPLQSGAWQDAIAGCDGVVNLAGAPISERWTPEHKQAMLNSRQIGTAKVVEAIANAEPKPNVLVNASAIGYYGTSETARFDETSAPVEDDFLSQVCRAWEAEAHKVKEAGVRLVILRFGIVLGMGGAIARMVPPFRLFAGGPIGSGRQWFSWIHREDLVSLILKALSEDTMAGIYNATTPHPVRMAELCHALGEVLNRPSWLPVPDFVLEALLGDGAKVVLEGQQVLPKRTEASGFTFQYPRVKAALQEILTDS
ncbi:putative NAD-dependent epimerase [Halomicronema hongdechloris C2206]|uniref:NAD-dependent epimerase n=1 Tax=Halomicronema hongdechloris C2206 TaxID=1641165 RepID=A0A1Z3HJF5_9CYAN|nr:TIGR01777 family oxidoreductase [Halomicronema hongdechloris]ASC70454.1 putative NAD-dependent epimerase [Halomicronema hongdechloris C2206]